MQIQDIDKVNHLIAEPSGMNALITHTNDADPAECELFIKLPGDFSSGYRAKEQLRHTTKASQPRLTSFGGCIAWQ